MIHGSIVGQNADPHVFLSGLPPMGEYLGFVKTTVDGDELDDGALAEAWRSANDHVKELRLKEPTYADSPTIGDLPEPLGSLGESVLSDPIVQRGFPFVPIRLGYVELDRMVLFQKHINLAHVARLRDRLGSSPSDADVFNLCLPTDRRLDPPTAAGLVAPNTWAFSSESNDYRVLEAKLVDASSVEIVASGAPTHVVAIMVGFGPNLFSAIHCENRLVLNNGSHRAYALREAGVTHVPCLIQEVSRRDELAVIAAAELVNNADTYLTAPRPPVLRDYFDEALRVVVPVARRQRQLTVQVGWNQVDVVNVAAE